MSNDETYQYSYYPVGGGTKIRSRLMSQKAALDLAEQISALMPGKWISVQKIDGRKRSTIVKFKDGAMYPIEFSIER